MKVRFNSVRLTIAAIVAATLVSQSNDASAQQAIEYCNPVLINQPVGQQVAGQSVVVAPTVVPPSLAPPVDKPADKAKQKVLRQADLDKARSVVAKFDLAMDRCLLELDYAMLKNTRDLGRIDGLFRLIINHQNSIDNVEQLRKQLVAKRGKLQRRRQELLKEGTVGDTTAARTLASAK